MGKPMGKPMIWDIHISGNPHVMFCVYIYILISIQYTYIYICRICRWMKEAMFGWVFDSQGWVLRCIKSENGNKSIEVGVTWRLRNGSKGFRSKEVEQAKRARWDGGTSDHFDVFMVKMLIKRSILGGSTGHSPNFSGTKSIHPKSFWNKSNLRPARGCRPNFRDKKRVELLGMAEI